MALTDPGDMSLHHSGARGVFPWTESTGTRVLELPKKIGLARFLARAHAWKSRQPRNQEENCVCWRALQKPQLSIAAFGSAER